MNTLIDAMLDMPRTSRLPLRVRLVDLKALGAAVHMELDLVDRRVECRVGRLPLVTGDHDLLRQVMQNLLSNALKYTDLRELAVI
ncbi:hypothetical protein [Deinococcus humi]|uniref:histidine kinase n=1 Tax=Deinococcus humi TaxID=662880 RepID=A0A7W8NGA5_9DEIO|nr:light-regulated signal transduction histidine kinase (bacteriophytochrome) [Deinococcus humi]GGO26300.1 hypothetical protein GCM10008949_17010 [Deinococcus humi]